MARGLKGITVEIGGNTAPLDRALNGVNQKSRGLQVELRQVERLLRLDPTNTELLAQKQAILASSVSATEEKLNDLKSAQAQVETQFNSGTIGEEQYRAFQRELASTEQELSALTSDLQNASRNLNEFGDNNGAAREQTEQLTRQLAEEQEALEATQRAAEEAAEAERNHATEVEAAKEELKEFGDSAKESAEKVGAGILAIGAATVAGAGHAINLSSDYDKAFNTLVTQTGASKGEFEELDATMENIYKNNFGESFDDVAKSLAAVKQQTGLTGVELQKATENALLMRDTFDMDVNESIRAVNMMMEQFGVSSDVAYSMLAQGAQNGLDQNGNLLDTINEYSVHFAQAGIGAEGMFDMLTNGTKAGVFDVDKLGDAVKEMGIKMRAGDADEAFKALGLNAKKTTDMFGKGGEEAQAVMQIVSEKLFALDDPIKQNQLGVQIFGTMWEDLGANGVKSLMNLEGGIEESSDALENINAQKYDDIGSSFAELGRIIEVDLVKPIGEQLTPIIQDMVLKIKENMPAIQEVLSDVVSKVEEFISYVVTHSSEIVTALAGIGTAFLVFKIGSLISTVVSGFIALKTATAGASLAMALLNKVGKANVFILIASLIAGVVVALVSLYKNNEEFRNKVNAVWSVVKTAIANAISAIVERFKLIGKGITDIINWFKALPERIQTSFTSTLNKVKTWASNMKTNAINAAKGFLDSAINGIKNLPSKIFKVLLNVITKIVTWGTELDASAKAAMGKFIKKAIVTITTLPSKIWATLVKVYTKVNEWGTGLQAKAKTACGKLVTAAFNTIKTLPGKFLSIGGDVVKGLWNGISNAQDWVVGKIKGFGNKIVTGIKDFFGIHSPSRKMRDEVGKQIAAGTADGIKDGTASAVNATKEMGKKISSQAAKDVAETKKRQAEASKARAANYKKDVKTLESKVTKENLSIAQQVKLWDNLRNKYKTNTDERSSADKKYYTLLNKVQADNYKNDVKILDKKITSEKLNSTEQVKLWDVLRKKYKAGTDERIKADKAYNSLVDKSRADRYKKDVQSLENKVSKEELTAAEQVKLWDKIVKKYKAGTDERFKAEKEYYKKVDEQRKEEYDNYISSIDKKKNYDQLTLAEEVALLEKGISKFKKGTDEREAIELEYYNKKKELNQKIQDLDTEYSDNCKKVVDDLKTNIQSLNDAYADSVKSRTDAITSSVGLFEEFSKNTDLSGDKLLSNLQTQVTGLEDWSKSLQELKGKGIDAGLLEELQAMGPKSAGEIEALLGLTDEELNQYVGLWQSKNAIAKEQATKELEGLKTETSVKIAELTAQAAIDLQTYANTYNNAMIQLGISMRTPVETTKTTMTVDGKVAVDNFAGAVETAAKSKKTKKSIKEINNTVIASLSTLPQDAEIIGKQTIGGIVKGLESELPSLRKTVNQIIELMLQAMRAKAQIHSPSRLFAKMVGQPLAQGVAQGFESEMAHTNLMDSVPSSLERVINGRSVLTNGSVANNQYGNNTVNIYAQTVDKENIDTIVDVVNRKLGFSY